MSVSDDLEAERATERIAARLRAGVAGLPLRSEYVEALAIEAQPAIQALLFALATDQAENPASLEHHETTAMIALLGRSFAMEGATPTAAYGVVPTLLSAFRDEGFVVPTSLEAPLSTVFLEGFVRGREERQRAEADRLELDRLRWHRLGEGVSLLHVRPANDPDALLARLEALAREAFSSRQRAVILDVEPSPGAASEVEGPLVHVAELMRSVGIEVVVRTNEPSAMEAARGLECVAELEVAVARAFAHVGRSVRAERSIVRPLRELFRGRGNR